MINGKKLIEVRNAGFINKGAQLMLFSIIQKIKEHSSDNSFALEVNYQSTYEQRIRYGLYHKPAFSKFGFRLGLFFEVIPSKIRKKFGIVIEKEVDIVIDAAGFAYTSQFGDENTIDLYKKSLIWRKLRKKSILLPQAFGPFESETIRNSMKAAIENVDLIFARDLDSLNHLKGLYETKDIPKKIKLAPDFTNLINASVPDNFDITKNRFCIIPNSKMLEKTSSDKKNAYIPFMAKATNYLLQKNLKPFMLVHESEFDLEIAKKINKLLSSEIPIVLEEDPVYIKGIIGASDGSIGSRFHGLVSALSQGVPCLATGWSHKYKMLFEDYDFSEGLIDVGIPDQELYKKIDLITNGETNLLIKNKLEKNSQRLKVLSKQMWEQVFNIIDENNINQ